MGNKVYEIGRWVCYMWDDPYDQEETWLSYGIFSTREKADEAIIGCYYSDMEIRVRDIDEKVGGFWSTRRVYEKEVF